MRRSTPRSLRCSVALAMSAYCELEGIKPITLLHCKKLNGAMQKPGVGGIAMASAKLLRRQAARCADIARATHDEESRERCRQLEQTYLHLADLEERQIGGTNSLSDNRAGSVI